MSNKNMHNNLLYTKDHEWVLYQDNKDEVVIGITNYAQEQLGDIVFIEMFEKNKLFQKGSVLGEIESVKSVSNILAPIDGYIIEINSVIIKNPELINNDPYDKGWILKYKVNNTTKANLLNEDEYNAYLKTLT